MVTALATGVSLIFYPWETTFTSEVLRPTLLGVIAGAALTAFIALTMHRSRGQVARRTRAADERTKAEAAEEARQQREHEEASAIAAAKVAAVEEEGRRRAELITALPTRNEQLRTLRADVLRAQMDLVDTASALRSTMQDAEFQHAVGTSSWAADERTEIKRLQLIQEDEKKTLADLLLEQAEVESMSDEDYLAKQVRLPGLD